MTITAHNITQDWTRAPDAYDLGYFVHKHAIPKADAIRILNLHQSDRDASDRAAHRLKG